MKRTILALLAVLACVAAQAEEPARAWVVDVGTGEPNRSRGHTRFEVYRFGVKRAFKKTFWAGETARLGGYWEASANYWSADHDDVFAVALSPVFVLSFGSGGRFTPYIEAGIGIALLSDDMIGGRDLSTSWQFEDRIGFGLRSGRIEVHYRYMHYSNADFKKPNDGVDAHVLGLSYRY